MANQTVQLIFQIQAQNQAALNVLQQAVSGLNGALGTSNTASAALAGTNNNLTVTFNAVAGASNSAASGVKKSADSMSEGIVKGIIYSEILNRVAQAIKEVTVDSALYAARTQQLGVIMDQLARTNNLSVTAVRQQADEVRKLGITTQESREVINRMIFAQLDLTKATDLARLAQNAAKIAGLSSSETLQGLINGIIEQRVQVLRTYGIQVQFEQALIRGAAALGKTKETLTDYERANIALNEVLAKGPRIMGTYEVSLSTASGQMQSMQRHIDEAKNALGEGFLPVLERVIEFLTGSSKNIQENAAAWQSLATHITSVAIAVTAAKLTPGGPIPKAIVGLTVGLGAEALLHTDAVEEQKKFSTSAIANLETQRRVLQQKYQDGEIKDKEDYLSQDRRLKNLQMEIEKNFTQEMAKLLGKRADETKAAQTKIREELKKKGISEEQVKKNPGSELGFILNQGSGLPDKIDLGQGHVITGDQIQKAIDDAKKPVGPLDKAGLRATPDIASGFDAVLGQFTQKAKEAQKAAEGGLDRAKEGLLFGEAKIEAQRRDALAKVATDFKQFTDVFDKTSEQIGTVQDPKQREELAQSIAAARAQYGTVVSRINQQYDLELKKDRRTGSVEEIQRGKKITDAQGDAEVARLRQDAENKAKLARAGATPGHEEKAINDAYKVRIADANLEKDAASARNKSDLDAAQKIFDINKDDKALETAKTAFTVNEIKAQAALLKETSNAEVEKQISILELRKKQRGEIQASADLVRKSVEEEGKLTVQRIKDQRNRSIQLLGAQAGPGDEQYVANLQIAARIASARQDRAEAQKSTDEQERIANQTFTQTGNRADLERTMADIRKQNLHDDYELEKAILDARMDKELQIANIRKQQEQQLRSDLGKLYDDLGVHGRGAKAFFNDILEQTKKQLFVNFGSILLKGAQQHLGDIIPGQQGIDPVTGKPTGKLTPLGKILQGTPLGVDPAKLAASQQMDATKDNTTALINLTNVLTGTSGATTGVPGSVGGTAGRGRGLGGILGGIFGGGATGAGPWFGTGPGGTPPFVNYGLPGGGGGSGGLLGAIIQTLGGKKNSQYAPDKVPLWATGIKDAASLGMDAEGIIGGIQKGGLTGALGAAGGALGAIGLIPGPQQPFVQAASALLSMFGMFGKTTYQQWEKTLNNRLASKYQIPASMSLTSDLSGASADFDYLGNVRTFSGGPSTNMGPPGPTVNINAMDAKSFADYAMQQGPALAAATRNMIQIGHPIGDTIKGLVGATS